jgi:hypothetical protein
LKSKLDPEGDLQDENGAMVLLELAQLLKVTLEFDRTSSKSTTFLEAVHARLGNSPESLNKVALIRHCAEPARSYTGFRKPKPAELISAILGFFMGHTVPPRTHGLIYCTSRHPLLRLFEGDRMFRMVGAQIPPSALNPARVGISTVIAVLRDARDEHIFCAKVLGPLARCIADSGLDVMIVGRTPELAASVANAVPGSGKCRTVDFPMIKSRFGLMGISLRCF